jgi:hypothetical protein
MPRFDTLSAAGQKIFVGATVALACALAVALCAAVYQGRATEVQVSAVQPTKCDPKRRLCGGIDFAKVSAAAKSGAVELPRPAQAVPVR